MHIVVVAAVIEHDGRYLLTLRPDGTHLADHWEFPGGKCHPHETHAEALRRELHEELDIVAEVGALVHVGDPHLPGSHRRSALLRLQLRGRAQGMLGQQMRWVARDELATLPFPDADATLVAQLAADLPR